MSKIIMYGTPTCKDCVIAKEVFRELGINYEFINIGKSQEATEKAIKLNNGVRRIPVILFEDGSILVEPTGEELKAKILSE
tara:strand:- start:1990 stop:2232 length:243 start_codon:yes stop_codon:yes gene_type:complete